MAPLFTLNQIFESDSHKCDLPIGDPDGFKGYFDLQSAKPGTFIVPGVRDLETYEPGRYVESSWIFFKGDPMKGPQEGHPFEMPFNNSVVWSMDIVRDNDTSKVVQELMAPTNSTPFWEGGAPFGKNANHSLAMPRLDMSCEYYCTTAMLYRWTIPEDLEQDTDLRLRLTTDVPATIHLSGKLRISNDSTQALTAIGKHDVHGLSPASMTGLASAGVVLLLLALCIVLRPRSRRISLE